MLTIAVALTTLVVTTVEDKLEPGGGALSLRGAIERANAKPGPHRITFSKKAIGYHSMASALEISARGPLTIDGDIDDDGLADVALLNGFAEKLIVRAGAKVTIVGVDFVGGNRTGARGASGARGADGAQGVVGVDGKNEGGQVSAPTDGGPGRDGKPGTSAENGENAAGIIQNFGKLELVRLGLAGGNAVSGAGGDGGPGGWGGFGGRGGKAIRADQNPAGTDQPPIVQDGGDGAEAGNGADGGDGGDGGHAAGAILNEATGELKLTDVTFGGRLGGFLVRGGSTAIAGFGGFRGLGGDGRAGGFGGDGSNAIYVGSIINRFVWEPDANTSVEAWWVRKTPSALGAGGAGANGGARGNDGAFGDGGDAASALLNLGSAKGVAAIGADGTATFAEARSASSPAYANGQGGPGGLFGDSLKPAFSECPFIEIYNNPSFTDEAEKNAPGDARYTPIPNGGVILATRRGPSGLKGGDGVHTTTGAAGRGKDGVLNAKGGVGKVQTAGSLVFVHPLGVQTPKKGDVTLDFNVIRLGKGDTPVSIKWSIEKAKKGPSVDGPVFRKAELPSGTVKFGRIPKDAQFDIDNSVKRVSLPINPARLGDAPEGYVIVLKEGAGKDVILGTAEVSGKIDKSKI